MTKISVNDYPGYFALYFVNGEDVTFSLDFNEANGDPYDFSGIAIEARIFHRDTEATDHQFTITVNQNSLIFLLPKEVTSTLRESSYLSFLELTDGESVVSFPQEVRFILIPQSLGNN